MGIVVMRIKYFHRLLLNVLSNQKQNPTNKETKKKNQQKKLKIL